MFTRRSHGVDYENLAYKNLDSETPVIDEATMKRIRQMQKKGYILIGLLFRMKEWKIV